MMNLIRYPKVGITNAVGPADPRAAAMMKPPPPPPSHTEHACSAAPGTVGSTKPVNDRNQNTPRTQERVDRSEVAGALADLFRIDVAGVKNNASNSNQNHPARRSFPVPQKNSQGPYQHQHRQNHYVHHFKQHSQQPPLPMSNINNMRKEQEVVWAPLDDHALQYAVNQHGTEDWARVSAYVRRSQENCMKRWMFLSGNKGPSQSRVSNSICSSNNNSLSNSSSHDDMMESTDTTNSKQSNSSFASSRASNKLIEKYNLNPFKTSKKETFSRKKRNTWSKEEDARLMEMICKEGPINWHEKAQHMPGRTGKACRDRWINQLDPRIAEVKDSPWTAEEDRLILSFLRKFGTKWSALKDRLPGRTELKIKNRWNSTMRRRYLKYLSLRDNEEAKKMQLLTEDGRLHPMVDMEEMLTVARNKNIVTMERRKAAKRAMNNGTKKTSVPTDSSLGRPFPTKNPVESNRPAMGSYTSVAKSGPLLSPSTAKARPYSALLWNNNGSRPQHPSQPQNHHQHPHGVLRESAKTNIQNTIPCASTMNKPSSNKNLQEQFYYKIKKRTEGNSENKSESTIGFILLSEQNTFSDARKIAERDLDPNLLPAGNSWKFTHSTLGPVSRKQESMLRVYNKSSMTSSGAGTLENPFEVVISA